MIKTIKKLLPHGLAWLLPAGYMRQLIDGLAISFDRLALFLETVATEANPATAVDCLEEWYEQYGMPWTDTGSVQSKQADALTRYVTLGDQDIVYLQRMIDEAGFTDILVTENPLTTSPDVFEFFVSGSVNTGRDQDRLETLVQRLRPAHCEPTYTITRDGDVWGEGLYGDAVCSGW